MMARLRHRGGGNVELLGTPVFRKYGKRPENTLQHFNGEDIQGRKDKGVCVS